MSNNLFSKTEAVAWRCSVKKLFLEISENSQENASFLIKLQALFLMPATLLKKRLWHRCSPVNFGEISKNTFFQRTSLVAALRDASFVKLCCILLG